jgi:serine/threonine-protein kinase RsbW
MHEPQGALRTTFPARPEGLIELHAAFDQFFADSATDGRPIGPQDQMAFLTAAAEVASNIVDHACHHLPDAHVHLALARHSGSMEACFEDRGAAWGEVVNDPANPIPHMGLGLTVARACLDQLDYERMGDLNRWTLLKQLSG